MSEARILVVDDEPALRRTLRANLVARGYTVAVAETGEDALHEATLRRPHLVILDLMLPGLPGLEVCRALRAQSAVPILVLSARGEEATKVGALDLGADDYLTKPFAIDELLARVRALLRRAASVPGADGLLHVGALTLDVAARQAYHAALPLDLTSREFDVLAFLMRHAGTVVTHRLLLKEVWGPEYDGETQYLRVFISRLRRKIEDDPARPGSIVTEPGVGYRLVSPGLPRDGGGGDE